ncbi:isoprenylcysteine carboxylmethyltransferase family protein [Pseudomonas sp. D(2018)]|uniref:methyltransferase family protein n=1 Tax=Pseudomonas sp. D(2018) TaxID=2502238 RepID=UPI001485A6F9|nr:DUF1295 domain-containing protein [Pseudomonas sp. D(2018)]
MLSKNYVYAMGWVILILCYTVSMPYSMQIISNAGVYWAFGVDPIIVVISIAIIYALSLPLYYRSLDQNHIGKSVIAWQAVRDLATFKKLTQEKRTALLAVLIKGYFTPLIFGWFFFCLYSIFNSAEQLALGDLSLKNIYSLLFNTLILIDTGVFILGYTFEHPRLGNTIKSADPNISGWFFALICYPPLLDHTRNIIEWSNHSTTTGTDLIIATLSSIAMLVLMAIYTWASVALGFKASNLTNRGIINKGPYKYVRHPAYAAKNLSWFVGGLPLALTIAQENLQQGLLALIGMLCWIGIYVMRAITEERHLSSDPDYKEYMSKVRYRFVPGII